MSGLGNPPLRLAGVSPLVSAGLSTQTLANLEKSMRSESSGKTGWLLPIPEGLAEDSLGSLKTDLANLNGGIALAETTAGGWGQGRQNAPTMDYQPRRFGPDVPEHNVKLRGDIGANVCAALGVPAALLHSENGGASREAYRQLLVSGIQPLAEIVTSELSEKLERRITFGFRRLAAADVAARARAYGSLRQAQMDEETARMFAGLEE